jgi:hypothetical protein
MSILSPITGETPAAEVPTLGYSTETTTTYQVTALLLCEGRLVVAKQWMERERTLDH